MGSNGTTQRKNKNTKNLILSNIESQTGSSSSSTSSQPSHNLSPVSYTSQVPSPLTTITPTTSKSLDIRFPRKFLTLELSFSSTNDSNLVRRTAYVPRLVGHHNIVGNDVDEPQHEQQLSATDATAGHQQPFVPALADDEFRHESVADLLPVELPERSRSN